MATVTVTQLCGERFVATTRGHTVLVDQPRADGAEAGPTPVELMVLALATCAAHYAAGYLRREGLDETGLRVDCRWSMRPNPNRVGRLELNVTTRLPLDARQEQGLLDAVHGCTVHNTLRQEPQVTVTVGAAQEGNVA